MCPEIKAHWPPRSDAKCVGLRELCPISLRFRHAEWILEIQNIHDHIDPSKFHADNKWLEFAISSDGFPLLIDLATGRFEILQNEYGDIDVLGGDVCFVYPPFCHKTLLSRFLNPAISRTIFEMAVSCHVGACVKVTERTQPDLLWRSGRIHRCRLALVPICSG